MAYSYENFNGDAATTDFAVNKAYLERDHITLLVDEVSVSFTWVNDTLIRAAVAPAAGVGNVKVKRTTPVAVALVDFSDDSTLVESDLDTANLQTLFVAQETLDNSEDVINTSAGAWDAVSKRISGVADGTDADDAVNKGQLDAASIANGNVPTPADPADDDKILTASGGAWAWTGVAYTALSGMAANVVSFLGAADYAAMRTQLSLVIGTNVQAYSTKLLALAGLSTAANKIPMFSGASTATLLTFRDEDDMTSDDATGVSSQQATKAYIDAKGLPSPTYTSSLTSLSAGADVQNFSHGIGAMPSLFAVYLVANTTTAQGYASGTRILAGSTTGSATSAVVVSADATNVSVSFGAAINLLDLTSHANEGITRSEYDWYIEAWA